MGYVRRLQEKGMSKFCGICRLACICPSLDCILKSWTVFGGFPLVFEVISTVNRSYWTVFFKGDFSLNI